MAKCPACAGDVATPFMLNVDAWRWLGCGHCGAKLERKNPRLVAPMASFFIALIALGRLGHRAAIVAEALMGVVLVVILVEFARPQLQVRKSAPKPEITLGIGGSPQG
jgi:hypothetical protein